MDADEKFKVITRNLQEVVGEDELRSLLKERELKLYWGTAPTGGPHLGYFVPMYKIADFLRAGAHVKILLADLHAYLDNMKSTWELLERRTEYYEFIIKEILKRIGVPLEKLEFVKGTDYQLSEGYTLDMYKMSALVTTRDTQKAGAEVVKQIESPKMSNLLYPILQALDEEHLGVDAQFGGVDQRKIFMLAREFLPKVGYNKRIHLLNPMVPGLGDGGKMSSSDPNSKIEFSDGDKQIRKKISKAYSADGVIEDNGLLAMMKYVIFRRLEDEGRDFVVERPEKYGGKVSFADYSSLEDAFRKKELSSIDLKQALSEELITLLTPLRDALADNADLVKAAYP
ncbi:MAG: tyrosine--tRNA ligase [Candidatus Woesearchaeota archaeon]